ncbi:thioredoxin family protein [Balneola sp. MJW-20]|uniref:thioredoxin family protein n=1 Tax=Gracilimonas aurantiaca TaxID=3234185 RepID=UPI00346691D6
MNKLKKIIILPLLLLMSAATAQNVKVLKLGDSAPLTDLKVSDVSGRSLSLAEAAGNNGLMVVFSCNTCPWVAKWEDRYNGLAELASQNGIGMIALNPNERIRNRGESMDDMKKRAQKSGYNFSYALDKDHKLADAFGATRTPEVFLFNGDMKLVYHGAIDDNANDANAVESKYAADAITMMIAGSAITDPETRSLGCTIKRVE